jgi:pilus assembly protein CpaB
LTSRAVTLLVQPDEAEKLGLASTEGTLLLALRSGTDDELAAPSGITVAKLMTGPKKTVRRVAKKPPPPDPDASRIKVDIIRGTQRSTEELDD